MYAYKNVKGQFAKYFTTPWSRATLYLFGLGAMFISLLGSVFYPHYNAWKSQDYMGTMGTVSKSDANCSYYDGVKRCSVKMRVEYQVNQQSYQAKLIPVQGVEDFHEIEAHKQPEAFVQQFPVGSKMKVFYDPNHPARSVLNRHPIIEFKSWFTVILMVLIVAWLIRIDLSVQSCRIPVEIERDPSRRLVILEDLKRIRRVSIRRSVLGTVFWPLAIMAWSSREQYCYHLDQLGESSPITKFIVTLFIFVGLSSPFTLLSILMSYT